jgi:polyhydroxyalkanoate synthesis regulator protein
MLSPQLLSHIIRFYGDSLQGFMGPYLERSLQVFLDQQQQFRNQLNSLMGQTPWSMLNEMTERNLDVWKSMQRGFLDAATAKPADPVTRTTRPTGKKAS